jgi:hypothetical protein
MYAVRIFAARNRIMRPTVTCRVSLDCNVGFFLGGEGGYTDFAWGAEYLLYSF